MIERERHAVNGKHLGTIFTFPDGKKLYLAMFAGGKCRSLHVESNSWCIDLSAIRMAERIGCTAIGVAHRIGKQISYYVTNMADMLREPSVSNTGAKVPQRRLARDKFLVNTTNSFEHVEKSVYIR